MKKTLIFVCSLLLLILLAGCSTQESSTPKAKLVPKENLVQLPGPNSMLIYKDGKGKTVQPADKSYKNAIEYMEGQLSQQQLEPTTITFDDYAKDLNKERSIAFMYLKPEKVPVNISKQGKKDLQFDTFAIMLTGKYKGHVFIGIKNGGYKIYKKN
ncbi:MAG TPA: hypothetical protein VHT34_04340 [Clostridia bacterium]|nr:hypothetical protein [Clostridia bacterium]